MTGLADLDVRRIVDYLQQQRADMMELLQRLALTESPSEDPTGLDQVMAILAAELKSSGMSVRRLPGRASGGLVYARQLRQPARSLSSCSSAIAIRSGPQGLLAACPCALKAVFFTGRASST